MAHLRLDDKGIELSTGGPRLGAGDEAQVRFDAGTTVLVPMPSVATAPPAAHPRPNPDSTADCACPTESWNDAVTSGEARTLQTLETVNNGASRCTVLSIRATLAHIGRGEHDEVIVADDSVSASYASIRRRESGRVVVTMDWTNGTYVSGERARGVRAPKANPAVRFGGVKVIFRFGPEIADADDGTRVCIGFKSSDQPRALVARRIVANRQATRVIPHGRRTRRRSSESRPQWSSGRLSFS